MRLRQPIRENVEALAAIACAGNRELAFARDALLVLDLGHEPRRVGLPRMHCDWKAEHRGLDTFDLSKTLALVRRDKNAVVVLHPHAQRRRSALRQAMHIL